MTISEDCYIETAGGVRIYPVAQLIDNGTYKLSTAKLSVAPDDAIVLSELETRRQIVPELNITAVDGEDGRDGQTGKREKPGRRAATVPAARTGKTAVPVRPVRMRWWKAPPTVPCPPCPSGSGR